MNKLLTTKESAVLREKTSLRPKIAQKTRWSSNFFMVQRFFQLLPFLNLDSSELAPYLLSPHENLMLKHLLKNMEKLQEVTITLQRNNCTLEEVRILFDALILDFPVSAIYLSPNANIVHSPNFENGVVKILANNERDLSPVEADAVEFLKLVESTDDSASTLSYTESLLKRKKIYNSIYYNLSSICPTSNVVERLFSCAGYIQNDRRCALTPSTFEEILFLKVNMNLWHKIN